MTPDSQEPTTKAGRALLDRILTESWQVQIRPGQKEPYRIALDAILAIEAEAALRTAQAMTIPNPEGSPVEPVKETVAALAALWKALNAVGDRIEGKYAAPDLLAYLSEDGWRLIPCSFCGGRGYTTSANPLPSGEPGEPFQVQCFHVYGPELVKP